MPRFVQLFCDHPPFTDAEKGDEQKYSTLRYECNEFAARAEGE